MDDKVIKLPQGKISANDQVNNNVTTNEVSFIDSGFIQNSAVHAKKIQFPDDNPTYQIEGLKHQVA